MSATTLATSVIDEDVLKGINFTSTAASTGASSQLQSLPLTYRTITHPLIPIEITNTTADAAASISKTNNIAALTSDHAASLLIAVIQYLVVQLQLTHGAWQEIEALREKIEASSTSPTAAASASTSAASPTIAPIKITTKVRKFIKMVNSFSSLFECIRRTFSPPTATSVTSSAASSSASLHATPLVKETLLILGNSVNQPVMIYRIRMLYSSHTTAASPSTPESLSTLTRSVLRQLIQHTSDLFPEKASQKMRSSNLRLHVLFLLDSHPTPNPYLSLNTSEGIGKEDAASDAVSSSSSSEDSASDASAQSQLIFKSGFTPRLIDSYQVPVLTPPSVPSSSTSSSTSSSSSSTRIRKRPPPKPKACLPFTIVIGTEREREMIKKEFPVVEEKKQDSSAHSTASTVAIPTKTRTFTTFVPAPIWYEAPSFIEFVRTDPLR